MGCLRFCKENENTQTKTDELPLKLKIRTKPKLMETDGLEDVSNELFQPIPKIESI